MKKKSGNNGIIPALSLEKTPSKHKDEDEPEIAAIVAIDQHHIEHLDSAIETNSQKLAALNTICSILIQNMLSKDIVKFQEQRDIRWRKVMQEISLLNIVFTNDLTIFYERMQKIIKN